jgi:DNA polymerase I-like protein with 3'-5' exonuclease and polymerase domains
MVTPNIQYLTKKYRSIVTAHKDKELRYIDYVQFEAGILANDSGDQVLINEYNEANVYQEIGNRINVNKYIADHETQRRFCKSLFYKYSYGMDIKNHLGVLKDFQLESHKNELSPLIITAFAAYKTLNEFREKIKQEALTENKIGTHQGNFRYRLENENNVSWAMSQRIQGTASLILKKAIIRLRKADKEIEFLIPMHDAALFQVPAKSASEKEKVIQCIFEEVFKEECPSITPAAKFKQFHE